MAVKFQCPNCSEDIYSTIEYNDSTAECKNCGKFIRIRETAVPTDETIAYDYQFSNPLSRRRISDLLVWLIPITIIYVLYPSLDISYAENKTFSLMALPIARVLLLIILFKLNIYRIGWPFYTIVVLSPVLFFYDVVYMLNLDYNLWFNLSIIEMSIIFFAVNKLVTQLDHIDQIEKIFVRLRFVIIGLTQFQILILIINIAVTYSAYSDFSIDVSLDLNTKVVEFLNYIGFYLIFSFTLGIFVLIGIFKAVKGVFMNGNVRI